MGARCFVLLTIVLVVLNHVCFQEWNILIDTPPTHTSSCLHNYHSRVLHDFHGRGVPHDYHDLVFHLITMVSMFLLIIMILCSSWSL